MVEHLGGDMIGVQPFDVELGDFGGGQLLVLSVIQPVLVNIRPFLRRIQRVEEKIEPIHHEIRPKFPEIQPINI
ncbi:hypothetical protein [Rossellomorea vietnamensis]|uniref:hypothetical protein n=1 Tax=Rossellomorea vietnamensis TaxID=218284 RepID=UPI003D29D29E